MGWATVNGASQSWTTQINGAQAWIDVSGPSSASRLNRIYPQSAVTQEDLSFIWRIQSEGAFVLATGCGVYIRSGITEPLP